MSFRTASDVLLASVAIVVASGPALGAQVAIKRAPSGFNLFTVEQDVELGRQAVAVLESQLQPVTDARTARFLTNVTSLLARHAAATPFAFAVKAVQAPNLDAFALPGGSIYVSRVLLGLARSEGEAAGLLAHSMAHVILRHGTERASRAYLETAGMVALGSSAGARTTTRLVNAVGGFGLGAAFLSFGQSDEYEADALGADLMARAGYDPVSMASMFAALRREHRRSKALDRFFTSHPPPPDRESRIRNLANVLGHGRTEVVGGFSTARLRVIVPASPAAREVIVSAGTVEPPPALVSLDLPAPSTRFARFTHPDSILAIEHPDNWEVFPSGSAVSFAPAGGVVERPNGEPNLLQGLIVNYYAPFEGPVERWNNSLKRHYARFDDRTRPRGHLEDATDDLVRQVVVIQPWLNAPNNSARSMSFDGARGYAVRLSGRSPVTGKTESVTVYTRALPDDQVVYLACVAPASHRAVERACTRMVQSLHVNEAVLHRQ